MKKILFIVLFSALVLAGCAQQGLSQSELFEKKQECAVLQDKMWDQLNSTERYWDRDEYTTLYLTEVFYSPIRNSCLYKSEFIYDWMYNLEINDYFTKEVIHTYPCNSNDRFQYSICSNMLHEKIRELKWE